MSNFLHHEHALENIYSPLWRDKFCMYVPWYTVYYTGTVYHGSYYKVVIEKLLTAWRSFSSFSWDIEYLANKNPQYKCNLNNGSRRKNTRNGKKGGKTRFREGSDPRV